MYNFKELSLDDMETLLMETDAVASALEILLAIAVHFCIIRRNIAKAEVLGIESKHRCKRKRKKYVTRPGKSKVRKDSENLLYHHGMTGIDDPWFMLFCMNERIAFCVWVACLVDGEKALPLAIRYCHFEQSKGSPVLLRSRQRSSRCRLWKFWRCVFGKK